MTFVQRAGVSLKVNVHFHQVALDGVFRARRDRLVFRRAEPPTPTEPFAALDDFQNRRALGLRRRGLLDEAGLALESSPCFDGPGAMDGRPGIATSRGLFERRKGEGSVDPDEVRFGSYGFPDPS